ncbi:cupin domain-containing protein [Pseudomonas sp. CR3202]|uniref:cupin domain-containing protein n=1 Tax=Pseudomonas sp. CR3202 TaxID=3351532 RepID=UPI003BF0E2E0
MTAQFIKPVAITPSLPGVTSSTPEHILLSGNGDTTAWIPFKSSDANVISGIWASEPFSKKKFHPDEMEFCYIIEGRVKISDVDGNSSVFSAGEAFVVEPGFDGVWESETPVRKFFVITKCR